jgi:hypothetical protein
VKIVGSLLAHEMESVVNWCDFGKNMRPLSGRCCARRTFAKTSRSACVDSEVRVQLVG